MHLDRLERELGAIHSGLRNRGHNPLEALAELTNALSERDLSSLGTAPGPELQEAIREGVNGTILAAAFQRFISDDLRGAFGQYLTPPIVADHVADLVSKHRSVNGSPRVLDPFAGSGILLEAVANRFPECRLAATEINPTVAAVTRSFAELSGHPVELTVADAFALWTSQRLRHADVVVTNPPFGAALSTVPAADLVHLGASDTLLKMTRPPVELCALELTTASLKPGGIAAVVLPLSVMTNTGLAAFRRSFFARNQICHMTILPDSTFVPFRGVARACVVLFRKEAVSLPYEFSMHQSTSVGYDDTGRTTDDEDLSGWTADATGSLDESGAYRRQSLASEVDSIRLGDIAEVFRGANPRRDDYVDDGPFLLKVGSLSGSFISWRDRKRSRVPSAWLQKQGRKALEAGDICFTATAHRPRYIALKVDLIDELPPEGAAASAEVIVVRLKPEAPISAVQLLFYLRSTVGRESIQSLTRGSTAHVYPKDILDLPIPLGELAADTRALTESFADAAAAFRNYLSLELETYRLAGAGPDNFDDE